MRHSAILCTAALASLCGAVLIANCAFGQLLQPLKQANPPQGKSLSAQHRPQPVARIAPRVYTMQQRAAAIGRTIHTTVPPDLSAPFTLTPGKPIIPDVATLGFGLVVGTWSGNLDDPSDQGSAEFCEESVCAPNNNYTGPGFWVSFRALQGRHYALDCRVTGVNTLYYTYMGQGMYSGGTSYATSDGHFIFATSAAQSDGDVTVDVTLYSQNAGDPPPVFNGRAILWGCDVSSF